MFDNPTIACVLQKPLEEDTFFTTENMSKAQDLLTAFLERETILARQIYLESLEPECRELLIRTYFHLVESAIQQTSEFKH